MVSGVVVRGGVGIPHVLLLTCVEDQNNATISCRLGVRDAGLLARLFVTTPLLSVLILVQGLQSL